MGVLTGILLVGGVAGLLVASFTDFRERLIYNELVLFVLAVGILLRLVSTPWLLWVSFFVAALILVLMGPLTRLALIGGGDVKLISASTLLVPPQQIPQMIVSIAIAGGVLSCIYLAAREILTARATPAFNSEPSSGFLRDEFAKIRAGEPMPYALAIFGGVTYSIATEGIS